MEEKDNKLNFIEEVTANAQLLIQKYSAYFWLYKDVSTINSLLGSLTNMRNMVVVINKQYKCLLKNKNSKLEDWNGLYTVFCNQIMEATYKWIELCMDKKELMDELDDEQAKRNLELFIKNEEVSKENKDLFNMHTGARYINSEERFKLVKDLRDILNHYRINSCKLPKLFNDIKDFNTETLGTNKKYMVDMKGKNNIIPGMFNEIDKEILPAILMKIEDKSKFQNCFNSYKNNGVDCDRCLAAVPNANVLPNSPIRYFDTYISLKSNKKDKFNDINNMFCYLKIDSQYVLKINIYLFFWSIQELIPKIILE